MIKGIVTAETSRYLLDFESKYTFFRLYMRSRMLQRRVGASVLTERLVSQRTVL